MSYKKPNSYAILVAISVIALTLATAASLNHYYSALAVSKLKKTGSGASSSSSSSSTSFANPKALTKKELSSFISCITTANNSQGLTHKVVTNCLDTIRGITPTTGGAASAAAASAGGASTFG